MVKIKWSESAKNDLKDIVSYFYQNSPRFAEYFLERIFESIENLKFFPKMGRHVLESDDPKDRELIFQNYRIIYRYFKDKIEIITIIHGSRLLKL